MDKKSIVGIAIVHLACDKQMCSHTTCTPYILEIFFQNYEHTGELELYTKEKLWLLRKRLESTFIYF